MFYVEGKALAPVEVKGEADHAPKPSALLTEYGGAFTSPGSSNRWL